MNRPSVAPNMSPLPRYSPVDAMISEARQRRSEAQAPAMASAPVLNAREAGKTCGRSELWDITGGR